jgi:hypothetical protein
MLFQDLTGQKFYKLTFLSYVGKGSNGQSQWLCECQFGTQKVVFAHHVKSGNVRSCGCLLLSENRANSALRHGGTKTPEWTSFHAAKKRCNPKFAHKYPDHAGRGIQFKFKDFQEFLNHIGPRPEPKFDYSLERINNEGHYEAGNVKWATRKEQARNRRCNNCLSLKEKLVIAEQRIKELEATCASHLPNGCSH